MSGKVTSNIGRSSGLTKAPSAGADGVTWNTTVQTSGFTAESGKGYLCNTTSAGFTVTLPASPSAGDLISFIDYAGTFGSNVLTLGRNSLKIKGDTNDLSLVGNRNAVTIIYADVTQGWITQEDGNVTTGTALNQTYNVQYLVVAGGGGGGAGGGGAGGYRTIATKAYAVVPGVTYPITVGAGGTGGTAPPYEGTQGSQSIFSGITSAGGGKGGYPTGKGGSGGGIWGSGPDPTQSPAGLGAEGNYPPVSPPQGNDGGRGGSGNNGGSGGGAGSAGGVGSTNTGPPSPAGTAGTASTANTIGGTSVQYAGGGGGGADFPGNAATGGGGGAGNGEAGPGTNATSATANSGSGGGGKMGPGAKGAGGSGVVIIRRLTSDSTSSSGTDTTSGTDTIHKFTSSGDFLA